MSPSERANITSIESMRCLDSFDMRWAGRVTRMYNSRMPKAIFYGELRQGDRGAPRKYFKDQHGNWSNSSLNLVFNTASGRKWPRTSQQHTTLRRAGKQQQQRSVKHETPWTPQSNLQLTGHMCTQTARVCKLRIGLHSHQSACHQASSSSQWSSQAKKMPTC